MLLALKSSPSPASPFALNYSYVPSLSLSSSRSISISVSISLSLLSRVASNIVRFYKNVVFPNFFGDPVYINGIEKGREKRPCWRGRFFGYAKIGSCIGEQSIWERGALSLSLSTCPLNNLRARQYAKPGSGQQQLSNPLTKFPTMSAPLPPLCGGV